MPYDTTPPNLDSDERWQFAMKVTALETENASLRHCLAAVVLSCSVDAPEMFVSDETIASVPAAPEFDTEIVEGGRIVRLRR